MEFTDGLLNTYNSTNEWRGYEKTEAHIACICHFGFT